MRPIALAAAVALATVVALPPIARAERDEHELPPSVVFVKVSPSIVVVEATLDKGRSQGSGVVVGKGEVVTNFHVVDGAKVIVVRRGKTTYAARLLSLDKKHDIALLRAEQLDQPAVTVRPSTSMRVGQRVYAIGAPRGLELTLSEGLVSALRPEKDGVVLQTTAAISPGSSGGGLFDATGHLVGITTLQARDSQNLNFAHPTEWMKALRKGGGVEGAAAARSTGGATYSLTARPEALECRVNTRATWGLFSGGAEILESSDTRGTWNFVEMQGQLPRLLTTSVPQSLVLSDLNRDAGFVTFVPDDRRIKAQYYFSVDDEGHFQLTALEPNNFHGQLRVITTSGPCDSLTKVEVKQRRSGARSGAAGADSNAQGGCEAGQAKVCIEKAQAAGGRGDKVGSLALLLRACDLDSAEGCTQAAALAEELGNAHRAAQLREKAAHLAAPAK